ncbi:MAG: prolyl aminopeptidase [Thermomicrobiales bacterium]|nr:prolyl aminopeptidase [Thermomicrobiales bacterium]
MRTLYPEIEPFRTWFFEPGDGHRVYVEECGNPDGKPVIFLHGGPGGGIHPAQRRLFDPDAYHIVLFDQRGCGWSTPYASVENNTTWNLVADIERIRADLGIERWQVFGGSWGSTLALAYAETHPDRVTELVLRGIFLIRPYELAWFYQEGTSNLFPDLWQHYLAPIPPEERGDLMTAYHRRLFGDDPEAQVEAARAWATWEFSTSQLLPSSPQSTDDDCLAFARIENHYFVNGAFFDTPNQLIENAHRIAHIPAVIVHGRYDVICPLRNAWELHQALPGSELHIIPDAGHSVAEPGITDALIRATDALAAGNRR